LLRKRTPSRGLLGMFFGKFNKAFDRSTESYTNFTSIVSRKITRGDLCPKRTWDTFL
jgi:hypothetical protein